MLLISRLVFFGLFYWEASVMSMDIIINNVNQDGS